MKRGIIFKIARVIAVLAISIVIAGVLMKMRPRAERKEPLDTGRLVEVFPARAERLNMVIETYGTVRPREELKLVAEVRGRVVGTHPLFEDGYFIEKGDRLIKIDPRTYDLDVERQKVQMVQLRAEMMRLTQEIHNLKGSIKIAGSDLTLANAELVRLDELSKRKVAAQSSRDKAEQRYLASLDRKQGLENQLALTGPMMKQLEARQKMAEVVLRQAELNLEHTDIIAPFNGWVLSKAVENGQYVNVGQQLGRIYWQGAFDVEVGIPTGELRWLPEKMNPEDLPRATIVFGSGTTERSWEGRVARSRAGMDEKTRTLPFIVEVDLPAADDVSRETFQLRPGMFVTVRIRGREISRVFVLPRHLVHVGDTVYIARGERLRIKQVRVLRRFKDSVYVGDGLATGDLIVKTPLGVVDDGMKIRIGE